MDRHTQIREFLTSRRAKITPKQAGLPVYGGDARRVPGLRREEVALLAGVSVDYYTRLERGNARGVSDSVLDNLARALQLDQAERTHLFDLVRAANAVARPRQAVKQQIRPAVQRILDAMAVPAFVRNARHDTLAANQLGRALFSPIMLGQALPVNNARFILLDPRAADLFPDWEDVAGATVTTLRWAAGRNPYDKGLTDLVGELSTRSEFFRTRWATHNVRIQCKGLKAFHHPAVGDLALSYESMTIDADAGLTLVAYSAEPATPSEDGLRLLASWAATVEGEENMQQSSAT
jgi:transcriptional regulator with XRE-family HTH domain